MLYGREAERAVLADLLESARASRSGALVLRGEPGVGKTALLEDVRERASDMQLLAVRGVESESELPFAGLHQLLRPALHLLDRLPGPQGGALRGALGLSARGGDDRFLISAACLTLISEHAELRPVLCLVDDAQWLDTPSADALLFVARRLDAEGIVLLFAVREGAEQRFEARELRELELGGLDGTAAAAVLARGGDAVARSVSELLIEQAGGNPLALIELPKALTAAQLAGAQPLPATLPLTRDVERLFSERVLRLPEPAQRLLTLVAADDSGQLAPVMRAAEAVGLGRDALGAAELSGLVSVRGDRIDMRHPLVRSAVYQSASSNERRAAHDALADSLDGDLDSDRRAWHRAAATLGPDAAVAEALEGTAERARLRSGHAAAAAALDRAAELSVDAESKARRLVAAARAAWQAGQPVRATALLDRADPIVSDKHVRAELDHVRGVIEWRCGNLLDACSTLMRGAAAIAPLDPRKALGMLLDAGLAGWDAGDYACIAEVGARALALPRGDNREQQLLADVLAAVGPLSQGDPTPPVLEAIARTEGLDEPRLLVWAALGATVAGERAIEGALLKRAADRARSSGAVDMLTLVLEGATVQGFLAGEYAVGVEATEGLRLARDAGLSNAASLHLASLTWLAAIGGRDDECRAHAAAVRESARTTGAALANSIAEWELALLDLGAGRPEHAAARLEALRAAPPGVGHPLYVLSSAPDLVEACVRSGRDDAARAAYEAVAEFARPGAPAWTLALAARCRALLARDGEAEREFAAALSIHPAEHRPYDRARMQLLLGEHLRRRRQRVEAREHLRLAIETFEALGAASWAERARAELRASGETARRRDPSTLEQLTPQELQVARLVAEGLSNKEVAAQLFLSPRTIDAHLRGVFTKLGVTSRTQLARMPLAAAG